MDKRPNNSISPLELAQLSVALAKNNQAPQLQFRQALSLLKDAERYLAGNESVSVMHAKKSADLALFMPKPFGWPELLVMLDGAIIKRSGQANRVLTMREVSGFLTERFSTTVSDSTIICEGNGLTTGALFIHQLDSSRLSYEDARKIFEEWRSFRKEQTRRATVARKTASSKTKIIPKKVK